MRTFLAAIVVASIILGLSSCGLMMFGAGNKQAPAATTEVKAEPAKKEAAFEIHGSFSSVWAACTNVINRMGLLTSSDVKNGTIKANIRTAKVELYVVKAQDNAVNIDVKAMKDDTEDPELAAEILSKIKEKLE